ncbi:hypothetical protein [Oryzifoliimicrobium ureilyticus]|uniref:hypothetical protein n=1 Tax=Oryzifoliimicrobium ureilyticus TaxID=3113724 RepID=UPI003075EEB1
MIEFNERKRRGVCILTPASEASAVRIYVTSTDLRQLLQTLYDAGASRVPASQLPWTSDDAGVIHRALNMQYMIRREGRNDVTFSLSEAGYKAIGQGAPTHMSLARVIRSLFGGFRFGGDL